MIGGAFVIFLFFLGLYLAGMIMPFGTAGIASFWRYVGWGLVVLAVLQWRTVMQGIRQSGKLLVFLLVVGTLALVFSGEGDLWAMFF